MSFLLPILLLVLGTPILLFPSSCQAQEYYVTPTSPPNPACPSGKPCHTLSYYASNVSLFDGKENVSLLFLDGSHKLSDQSLRLANITLLTMVGSNRVSNLQVSIEALLGISIENVSLLTMQNIMIMSNHVEISNVQFLDSSFVINITDNFSSVPRHVESAESANFSLHECMIRASSIVVTTSHKSFTDIKIQNCQFLYNQVALKITVDSGEANLTISNSTFLGNVEGLSLAVYDCVCHAYVQNTQFVQHNETFALQFVSHQLDGTNYLSLKNVSFFDNTIDELGPVMILGPVNLTVDTCSFENNYGFMTMLFLHSVSVLFLGDTTFSNNIGSTGGAIYMSQSTLWLDNGTEINFVNNSASNVGGAIYVEEVRQENFVDVRFNIGSSLDCFYQLTYNVDMYRESDTALSSVHFVNNSAQFGGDDIYGASVNNNCTLTPDKQTRSYQIQNDIFDFQSQSLFSVSSSPKRVCLCENDVPQCDKIEYIFRNVTPSNIVYGETFDLSLVLVGGDFGPVTGGVFVSLLNNESYSDVIFGSRQKLQQISNNNACTNLKYSIHAKNDSVTTVGFLLSRDSITVLSQQALSNTLFSKTSIESAIETYKTNNFIEFSLLYSPVLVTVNLLPCPLGFAMNNGNYPVCECETFLSDYVSDCTIVNGTGYMYRRRKTTWISYATVGNSSDIILAQTFCPFSYCKTPSVTFRVDIYNPDVQCAYNHSGILCGGCPPNLSLALGSSQCLPCSNDGHIALFLVFAVAGVALVFFIKVFDLTVARGTINGLIFYANVIWINQCFFFTSGNEQTSQGLRNFMTVIKVFIAWINLDFGIETCFLDGLDAYWKTWLQFVFPIYLWFLAALIILVCRYSTRATKFFGNNAVSVLATLFLLSYVKLLRTIVSVLGSAILQQYHPVGIRWVWLLDGNVPYLGLQHSFLFAAALLTLIFLCLPYTSILLFLPLLKKITDKPIFRWVSKLKPLFDAYTGPLKDRHHYWVGLSLLARVVIAVMLAVIQATKPIVNINVLGVVSVLLCILVVHVYKKTFVMVLEISFLFNLIVVTSCFLSTEKVDDQIKCSAVSVMVSFVTFLGILVFHVYSVLKNYNCRKRKEYDNLDNQSTSDDDGKIALIGNEQTVKPTKTTVGFREPLLDSMHL